MGSLIIALDRLLIAADKLNISVKITPDYVDIYVPKTFGWRGYYHELYPYPYDGDSHLQKTYTIVKHGCMGAMAFIQRRGVKRG